MYGFQRNNKPFATLSRRKYPRTPKPKVCHHGVVGAHPTADGGMCTVAYRGQDFSPPPGYLKRHQRDGQ
jgi:hypothetical protein